jgi:Mn-dependent DtxR family transcriptional regulator
LLLREAECGSVDLTQATLAAMLGVPRPSLNRLLRKLETSGVVSLRYRQVHLLDHGRLAAMATGVRHNA